MCNIENCTAPVKAKGLCAKHYARTRRHGSPDKVNRAGRRTDQLLGIVRGLFPEYSKRTQALYVEAWRRFLALEAVAGHEGINYGVKKASRANQSLNISKLNRISIAEAVNYLNKLEQSQQIAADS